MSELMNERSSNGQNSGEPTLVRYSTHAGAARITLDSPHNRNAISTALLGQLLSALERAAEDTEARVVVLGHTGGTFCAGADLSEASDSTGSPEEQAAERTRAFLGLLRAIISHPKPVIAAVDGHVRAGGMGLVASCDLAIAGPASTFAVTEVRLGLGAAMISLPLEAKVAPRPLASAMLTGSTFAADTAREIGLITEAVADLEPAIVDVVEGFRPCSPQGLAETKALLGAPLLHQFDTRGEDLATVSARLFTTPEVAEGMTAFLERRLPSWAVESQ